MSKATSPVITEDREGIRIITINRPEALNALNQETLDVLTALLRETATATEIGAVVVTGAGGKAFVAGADISHMAGFGPIEARHFAMSGHQVMSLLEQLPQPVIAAVNGYALGGGTELALSCDFIYASDNAVFGQPEVELGLLPGFGGTVRMMRKLPAGRARELILTGSKIKAPEALAIGLINRIVERETGSVLDAALATARTILGLSTHAVRAAKKVMRDGIEAPQAQACTMEIEAFAMLFATDHPQEGTTAFLERRKAQFSPLTPATEAE